MTDLVSWAATIATITAALMTASNLGARITGYGFAVFTVGSLNWLTLGLLTDQYPLVWTNAVLTGVNLFGVWRWLGRQARIEDGASSAAQASHNSAGESLFAVSLLAKAPITDSNGNSIGTCVDAMAGCTSGRLRYVVASEGGVAGVGERLRRLPWSDARIEDDRLVTSLDASRLCALEPIAKDEWPAA